ncbi:MAG: hypothetical protein ACXWLZ_03595 [Rhizomicrobium sp.]
MDSNTIAILALCLSGILFAFNVFDRIWGGGSKAATAQAAIKEYVNTAIAELRKDVFLRHDTSEGNVGQSLVALKDMAHQMQLDAVTFRAMSAETYMRRDSYYKAMSELKADVNSAFDKLDSRLARMEHAMLSNAST